MAGDFDVIVLGGGAAGMMAAITAGQRGKRVLLLEVSNKLGKKILMSGGGRCNFTNLDISADNYICANPHFVKSALAQYSQWDFIALVAKHGIAYHEKEAGQLFCDRSAKDILEVLTTEMQSCELSTLLNCSIKSVEHEENYQVTTNQGVFKAASLIVATGGLSIPTLGGASGLAYQLAQQFGLSVLSREASLVPFTLTGEWHQLSQALSGVALEVEVSVPSKSFVQSMLFTHRGLSGPAILQISNYWHLGQEVCINLLPGTDLAQELKQAKRQSPQQRVRNILIQYLPKSLVSELETRLWPGKKEQALQHWRDVDCDELGEAIHTWILTPSGTEGYRTAEVTRGGVSVEQISSKTMEVKHQKGLYFIGEALEVTGHLGGYNFQWAWSSGYVAGMNA